MTPIARGSLVLGFTLGLALAVLHRSAAAADPQPSGLEADQALMAALQGGDKKTAATLLDPHFRWTDTTGTTRTRTGALKQMQAVAGDAPTTEMQVHDYGRVLTILGARQNTRVLRIWVKRPAGWRAFLFLDTPVAGARVATVEAAAGQGDCDNPCRSVPYAPKTPTEKAILATWQKTKIDEWHPDAADWALHIADEFMIVNNTAARNKTERVAIAQKQQANGIGAPGDPVTSMRIVTFGNAAVMTSHHTPYRGGKPYYNVRVWVKREGNWLLALSQQASIQSAAAVPAVALK